MSGAAQSAQAGDVVVYGATPAGVAVRLGERLVSAQMAGKRITSIKLVGSDQIFAEQFIDATYTGDLMAAQMDCTVQDVPYPALRRRLLAQSQVLDILPPR